MAIRRSGARASAVKNAFRVWQFVRIMVRLEETAKTRGRSPRDRLYREWRASWDEVDRALTRLGGSDADAFADLMMDHDVVLQCSEDQKGRLAQVIDEVVAQLSKAIAAREGSAEQLRHLRFERTELVKLRNRIVPAGRSRK